MEAGQPEVGPAGTSRLPTGLRLAVALALWPAACGPREAPPTQRSPRPVVTVDLTWSDPSEAFRITGSVDAWADEDVAFEVSGPVVFMVQEGTSLKGRWVDETAGLDGASKPQVVVEGDILARIDPEPYEAALRAATADRDDAGIDLQRVLPAKLAGANAELLQAQTQFDRTQQAHERGAATDIELVTAQAQRDATQAASDQAQAGLAGGRARLDRAEAALTQAQLDLEHTTLYAAFPGEVAERYVTTGGYAAAGQPLARLVMMDPIQVRVTVSAETNRRLSVDDIVHVHVAGRDTALLGKIYRKSTTADPQTRTFTVTVITRNRRALLPEPQDPGVLELPRVAELFPVTSEVFDRPGPLFVDERRALHSDDHGAFVWLAEDVSVDGSGLDPVDPTFVVRKVRVIPGERRLNYRGNYLLRELADPGGLHFLDLTVFGVPEGVQDGDRVALVRESWVLRPGGLVEVQFLRQQASPGWYVPMQAVVSSSDGTGWIFVVRDAGDGRGRAERVAVTSAGHVGERVRIEGEALESGMQVVVRGANYLQEGESVTVVRTDPVTP